MSPATTKPHENSSEAATDLKTPDAPTRKVSLRRPAEATPSRGGAAVKRVLLLLLAVCAAAALLYHYWGFWKGDQAAQTAPPPPAVTVSKPLIREHAGVERLHRPVRGA